MKWMYFFSVLIFIACSTDKKESVAEEEMKAEEVGDTSMVQNKTKEENTNSDSIAFSTFKIDKNLSFEEKVEKFAEKYKLMYSETEVNKPIVPERYSSKYSKKIALRKNTPVNYGKTENVFPVAQLWFYQYEDSTSCRNVLNNWLQCYGFDCTPVEFMKDLPAIKTTPSMAIITDKELVFLQYQCEHIGNNWDEIKKELETLFGRKTYYTITLSDCGKKLVWKKTE